MLLLVGEPSEDKRMLGLDLGRGSEWSPAWDAEGKTAVWRNSRLAATFSVRLSAIPLPSMTAFLNLAAPVQRASSETLTDLGWWAVVHRRGPTGAERTLVYVRKLGRRTAVCEVSLGPQLDEQAAVELCEGLRVQKR